MSDALFNTKVADVVVPTEFDRYIQQLTEEKSRLIQSGALQTNAAISAKLAGGGITFSVPSWKDLDNDAENVPTDSTADRFKFTMSSDAVQLLAGTFAEQLADSHPKATGTSTEVQVRLSRNQSWAAADLAADLAGSDPVASVGSRIATYWARRLQAAFIATVNGVCKDNGANDSGDYAHSIVGGAFVDGVTNFSAPAALDTMLTMGDSDEALALLMVHSVVYNRMRKQNLIDFIPDARGEVMIPTYMGKTVIVDDGMPTGTGVVQSDGSAGTSGMFESWFFGVGALQFGEAPPENPFETERNAAAGNGGGQTVVYSRKQWCIHPVGHAYTGTAPDGGPSNAAATNMLNIATSWNRVFPERKQIKFARLISRES